MALSNPWATQSVRYLRWRVDWLPARPSNYRPGIRRLPHDHELRALERAHEQRLPVFGAHLADGRTVSAETLSKYKGVNERYTEFANGFSLEKNDITLMDRRGNGAAARSPVRMATKTTLARAR